MAMPSDGVAEFPALRSCEARWARRRMKDRHPSDCETGDGQFIGDSYTEGGVRGDVYGAGRLPAGLTWLPLLQRGR